MYSQFPGIKRGNLAGRGITQPPTPPLGSPFFQVGFSWRLHDYQDDLTVSPSFRSWLFKIKGRKSIQLSLQSNTYLQILDTFSTWFTCPMLNVLLCPGKNEMLWLSFSDVNAFPESLLLSKHIERREKIVSITPPRKIRIL